MCVCIFWFFFLIEETRNSQHVNADRERCIDLATTGLGNRGADAPEHPKMRLASIDPKKYVCAPKTDGERVTIIMGATDSGTTNTS